MCGMAGKKACCFYICRGFALAGAELQNTALNMQPLSVVQWHRCSKNGMMGSLESVLRMPWMQFVAESAQCAAHPADL